VSPSGGNAPSWLFSFVDLAFLVLIAITQLAPDEGSAPDLGALAVPRIGRESTAELPAGARDRWQLRVHPPGAGEPFELAQGSASAGSASAARLAEPDLELKLNDLRSARAQRPLLAPHEDSRSRDLLVAATLLDEIWPGGRRALVDRRPWLR
jgi:hypothetical protein